MRNVLETFGLLGMYGFGFMLLFGFLLVFIIQRKKWKATEFNLGFLFIMFAESVVWSAGLFSIMNISNQVALMNPNTRFLIQRVVISWHYMRRVKPKKIEAVLFKKYNYE